MPQTTLASETRPAEHAGVVPPPVRRERASYHGILLAMSVVALVLAAVLTVPDREHVAVAGVTLPPMCAFRSLFGLDCPGCGMTRCFVSAAHGRLAQAWQFHSAGLFLFALLVAQVPFRSWQIWRLSRGRDEWRHRALTWIPWLLLVTLVGHWLWRMSQIAA